MGLSPLPPSSCEGELHADTEVGGGGGIGGLGDEGNVALPVEEADDGTALCSAHTFTIQSNIIVTTHAILFMLSFVLGCDDWMQK